MKTKTILTYGAIAAGAYLAYTMFFKKKSSDANFANANGGLLANLGGSVGGVPAWVMKYVNQNKVPSYIWKSCWNEVSLYVAQQRKANKVVSQQLQQVMFMRCIALKRLEMQNQMNLGSSSVGNAATM